MNSFTLPAPAKLNLFLHITGRREDGYHTLQTVFQLLDHGDNLTFTINDSKEVSFSCNIVSLEGPHNLIMQAARLLEEETGVSRGTDIHLEKVLPEASGLGGGSSNAATTLIALNRLWDCKLETDDLARLGLALGADVPVFIKGKSAWAEGIGENLHVVAMPERWYLVLTPDCHVSTKAIFSHPELTRHTDPIKIPAFPFPGSRNDCQMLVSSLYSPVKKVLDWLSGFAEARMSGTGSSVFAAFETEQAAQQVLDLVSEQAPENTKAFVARGVNISPLHEALIELNKA
ncbi:MAG: 4-(cytidine 5'-diphospho)-2-C-methyl-D-erythritol kinase [Gammaproteobacteria bacterium]|nr:4-(cytidine 5'-diphospho)-2-C-methyl-D-erythritol kinase [Gammaproteobacteria bacterium]